LHVPYISVTSSPPNAAAVMATRDAAASEADDEDRSFVLYIRPSYRRAVVDVVRAYGWTRIYYIYTDPEGTRTKNWVKIIIIIIIFMVIGRALWIGNSAIHWLDRPQSTAVHPKRNGPCMFSVNPVRKIEVNEISFKNDRLFCFRLCQCPSYL